MLLNNIGNGAAHRFGFKAHTDRQFHSIPLGISNALESVDQKKVTQELVIHNDRVDQLQTKTARVLVSDLSGKPL